MTTPPRPPEPGAPPPARRRAWVAAVVAVTLLGALVRWHGLGREGYWGDETTSITVARLPVAKLLANRAHNHNPPLYFLLLKGWIDRFGDGETATRSLSLVFGVLAVPAVAALGAELLSPAAGAAAALLLAVSPLHLRYTQETRAYSLLVLLAILSFLLYARVLRRGRGADLAGLLLVDVLMIYTHLSAWLLVALQAASFPVLARGEPGAPPRRRWWLAQGALLAASAPWWAAIAFSVSQVAGHKAQFHGVLLGRRGRPEELGSALQAVAGSHPALALTAAAALLGALALPGLRALLPPGDRRGRVVAGLWVLAGMAGPVLLALFLPIRVKERYLIAGLPALLLLAAAGAARLRPAAARAGLVAALALLGAVAVARQYREPVRVQWREAFGIVAEGRARGDAVVLVGVPAEKGVNGVVRHYLRRRGIRFTRNGSLGTILRDGGPPRVWAVFLPGNAVEGKRGRRARGTLAALRALDTAYPERREWPLAGVSVRRYGRPGPPPPAPGG